VTELDFKDFAPLATLTRGGLNESFHSGIAVLVDSNGQVLESHGSIEKPMYPRSALKPVQALVMRELGLDLAGVELVLSMASHLGTTAHIDAVDQILKQFSLSRSDLLCPRAFPGNPKARAESNEMSRIAMNCSGKHASFLATCQLNGWDTKTYLDPSHPLQQKMLEKTEELAGEKVAKVTVDGCGAPLFAISTLGLAKAISGFSKQGQDLVAAAKANPWAIGDAGGADSLFLEQGFMAKIGAEGVFVVSTDNHHAVAVKIADGNLRAAPTVALELLNKHNLIGTDAYRSLQASVYPKVFGGDQEIGKLVVTI
jgi:L-asparaginase II